MRESWYELEYDISIAFVRGLLKMSLCVVMTLFLALGLAWVVVFLGSSITKETYDRQARAHTANIPIKMMITVWKIRACVL